MFVTNAPSKYIQGENIIDAIGELIGELGGRILVVSTASNLKRLKSRLEKALAKSNKTTFYYEFGVECTQAEIDAVCRSFSDNGCEVIVGCGGGKVIDTARAAADAVGCPLVVVPTSASNDSPCSALSVIHDDNGRIVEVRIVKNNPTIVLVDTGVIANAPARLLVAGMGDALATWFEAIECEKNGGVTNAGGKTSPAAMALAESCHNTLLKHGAQAVKDVKRHIISDELEKVVHANIYLSGMGFESGGVAAAHGINEGLSVLPETARLLHGELVGFGVLCLLELAGYADDMKREIYSFMRDVGLPVNLSELELGDLREEQLIAAAQAAYESPPMRNMSESIKPQDIFNAIIKVNSYCFE